MRKIFLIVLYKCSIEDSRTCQFIYFQNLAHCPENVVYIWDNSPDQINSYEKAVSFFGNKKIIYNHTPENVPLSKIYNKVLNEYQNSDAIQIFDQDSFIVKESYNNYIDDLLERNKNVNVFLPRIYSGKILYSPGLLFVFKGLHFRSLKVGLNKNRNFTAIGSGILFRPQYCINSGINFCEDLSLYSVDTDFTYKLSRKSPYFYVMDLDFSHDLSENNLSNTEKKKRRRIQLEGLLIIYRKNILKRILTKLYIRILKLVGRI